jgi:hypothetical protein
VLSRLPFSLRVFCAYTYEGVDGLEASLHRLVHRLSGDNAWRFQLDSGTLVGQHGALSVDSVTERVNDSAKHALADGHIDDRASSLDDVTFLNLSAQVQKIITISQLLLACMNEEVARRRQFGGDLLLPATTTTTTTLLTYRCQR